MTAASVITLTSTPTVTLGYDGQEVRIVNVGTNAITFSSNSAHSGSDLSLGASTRVVGAKGLLSLVYNNALGRWVETGFNAGGDG